GMPGRLSGRQPRHRRPTTSLRFRSYEVADRYGTSNTQTIRTGSMSNIATAQLAAELTEDGVVRPIAKRPPLTPAQRGLASFWFSEAAFFCTLIVPYISSVSPTGAGLTPAILSLPLVIATTVCLLLSSGTMYVAERRLHAGALGGFVLWWSATIALGIIF